MKKTSKTRRAAAGILAVLLVCGTLSFPAGFGTSIRVSADEVQITEPADNGEENQPEDYVPGDNIENTNEEVIAEEKPADETAAEENSVDEAALEENVIENNEVQGDSLEAMLGVNGPQIVTQPEDVSVAAGENFTVSVEAVGEGLTYQWQYKYSEGEQWKNFAGSSAKTDTFTKQMRADLDGLIIHCVVTDSKGNSVSSTEVKASIKTGPQIVTQPEDVSVATGEMFTVSVEAVGEGLTYQWQYKYSEGEQWKNFAGSSAKTETFSKQMRADLDGLIIHCVVTDSKGNSVSSTEVKASIKTGPQIVTQPEDVSAAVGETFEMSVEAAGEGLTYQWQYKYSESDPWKSFAGSNAKSATFTKAMRADLDGLIMQCIVTDNNGKSVTSTAATVSLGVGLKITKQPEDVSAAVGETFEMSVEAAGEGLTYQWQYKYSESDPWKSFAGSNAKSATFTKAMRADLDGLIMQCIVTDNNGKSVTSTAATVSLGVGLKITKQPEDVSVAAGEKFTVSVEAVGEGLTYQWQYKYSESDPWKSFAGSNAKSATFTKAMRADLDGLIMQCIVTDNNGKSVTSTAATVSLGVGLKITKQPEDVSAAVGETFEMSVEAAGEGLTYQWQYKYSESDPWKSFAGSNAKSSTFTKAMRADLDGLIMQCIVTDNNGKSVTSTAATVSLGVGLKITKQPEDVSAAVGETFEMSVEAAGEGLTYQWQYKYSEGEQWKNFAGSSAKTETFTKQMRADLDGLIIHCVVTDSKGNSVSSTEVKASIKTGPQIVTQPEDVSAAVGETFEMSVEAAGEGLTYQWQYKYSESDPWKSFAGSNAKSATFTKAMRADLDGLIMQCIVTDGNGNSVTSNAATLTIAASTKVTNVTATPGNGIVSLSWNKFTGATQYKVTLYKIGENGEIGVPMSAYTNSGTTGTEPFANNYCTVYLLEIGAKYGFTVSAYVDGKWTEESDMIYSTPVRGDANELPIMPV